MYSSSTVLVLTVGDGVYGFTFDPLIGEFVLTHDRIQIPESGKM
jgi:fructose-1,6-bisphosphatase I